MFRTVPLIIMSFSLYTQQWYMSFFQEFIFWDKTLHVSDSSFVHHQEFFTVHTAMVYIIQLASRIRSQLVLILLASCQQTCMTCTNFSNLFFGIKLHVSDSSSVHHQEFFTVHTAMAYVIQLASRMSANLYDIYHCCVYSEKVTMDRGTVRTCRVLFQK